MRIKFSTPKDKNHFILQGSDLSPEEKNIPAWKIDVQWLSRDGRDLTKLKTLAQELDISVKAMGIGPNPDPDYDANEEWVGFSLNGTATLDAQDIEPQSIESELSITMPGRKRIRLVSGSGAHFSWGQTSGLIIQVLE
jgi:hypothetical protein